MTNKGSKSPKTIGLEGSYQALDFHPYEMDDLDSDVFSKAVMLGMSPTTRYKPYMQGAFNPDVTARRAAIHYLRQPFISRDVWYSIRKKLYDTFSRVKESDQTNWLARNSELIIDYGEGYSVAPETQSQVHAHYMAHYIYDTMQLILFAIQATVIGRLEGFTFSRRLTSSLKFSLLNSIVSNIKGIPINRKLIQYCVDQMKLLADRNDKSLLMSCPVWLPNEMAHMMDFPVVNSEQEAALTRHLTVEELNPLSAAKTSMLGSAPTTSAAILADADYLAFVGRMGIKRSAYEARNWDSTTVNPGMFIKHFIDTLQAAVDQYQTRWTLNSIGKLNISATQNKLADLWFTLGVLDDRLKSDDIAKWADSISQNPVDLEDYAKANWGKYATSLQPGLLSRTDIKVNFLELTDGEVTTYTLGGFQPKGYNKGVAGFDDWDDSKLDMSARELFEYQKLVQLDITGIQRYYPFAAWLKPSDADFDDFRDLRAAIYMCHAPGAGASILNAFKDFPTAALSLDYFDDLRDFANPGVMMSRAAIMKAVFEMARPDGIRFINSSVAGKFVENTKNDKNMYFHPEFTRGGVFMPICAITPCIDPYDVFQHGLYELIDLNDITPTNSLAGALPDLSVNDLTNQEAGIQTAVRSWLGGTTLEIDNANILTSEGTGSNADVKSAIGIAIAFTGDMFGRPWQSHLLRSDIFRHSMAENVNIANDAAEVNESFLPVSPFRQPSGADVMTMMYATTGILTASLKKNSLAYTGLQPSMNGTTRSTINDPVVYDPDQFDNELVDLSSLSVTCKPSIFWVNWCVPLSAPSASRQSSETSDGMSFLLADFSPSLDSFPPLVMAKPVNTQGQSRTATLEGAGVIKPQRKFKGKRDFKSKRFDFKKTTDRRTGDDSVIGEFPQASAAKPDTDTAFVPESKSEFKVDKTDKRGKVGKR